MVWFRVTGRYWTRTNTKRGGRPTVLSMHSLGPRDCLDIRILIRFDARRPVAPRLADGYWNLRHGYNAAPDETDRIPEGRTFRFQSGCANYWDYTHDWNGGIFLVFSKGWEFRISFPSSVSDQMMLVYHSILLELHGLHGLFGWEKIRGIGEICIEILIKIRFEKLNVNNLL